MEVLVPVNIFHERLGNVLYFSLDAGTVYEPPVFIQTSGRGSPASNEHTLGGDIVDVPLKEGVVESWSNYCKKYRKEVRRRGASS